MLKTDDPGAQAPPPEDEVQAIQDLVEAGRAAEAEPRLRSLIAADPDNAWLWVALGRCYEAMGDPSAELDAVERALALDPSRERPRMRAAILLGDRGDIAATVAHYQILSDTHPKRARLALRLARFSRMLGDAEGEAAAWRRLLATEPDHLEAHSRLADLLEEAGRPAEAMLHLKRFLQTRSDKTRAWARLARMAELAGDRAEAWAAWAKVAELDPAHVEAPERLAALRLAAGGRGSRPGAAGALRVQVLGNCQSYAMGRCLRALLPDAEITALNWSELTSPAHVARLVESLGMFDVVVAQPVNLPELAPLSPKALIRGQTRCIFYPGVNFTGFQPDAVRAFGKGLTSLIGEWHSALIMAAWRMAMPPRRAEELFNAYVYGVLGYFDEYAKASRFLVKGASRIEWDLSAELRSWPAPFVHTANHPKIGVMMDLARGVCSRMGLEPDPEAVLPPDPFAGVAWPIYPEIGRRLGLSGEMTFVSRSENGRAFALDEAIDWYYAVYARTGARALVVEQADEVIEVLKREGI